MWQSDEDGVYTLTQAQRLLIKRAKIDIKLLKAASDENAKYDLFQRLNSGGSRLTPQEVRTCLIIMENPSFYCTLQSMSQFNNFKDCLPLTERAISEQENIEYVIRYIVARHYPIEQTPSSLHEFLDDSIIELIRNNIDMKEEITNFERVFTLLNNSLGADSFKRYNKEKECFTGATTISAFEAITPALSKKIDFYESKGTEYLRSKIIELHKHPNYSAAYQRRSTDRYKSLLKIGEEVFNGN